jgi:hypothetical protein
MAAHHSAESRPLLFSNPSSASLRRIDGAISSAAAVESNSRQRTLRSVEEGHQTSGGSSPLARHGATASLSDDNGSDLLKPANTNNSGPTTHRRNVLTRRIKYYIPGTSWIPQYSFSLFGGDFLAGLTVACLLVPQSISYALSLANMNPVTGLVSLFPVPTATPSEARVG